MNDIPYSVETDEPTVSNRAIGLVAGMKDGHISSFKHKGIWFHRESDSVVASPEGPPQAATGGRLLLKSAALIEVVEWMDNKAAYYNE